MFHCLSSPLWSPSKKTPLLQNTPGELQRSVTSLCLPFPRPRSQHSQHLLSPSRPSASQRSPLNCIQRRAGFRRDAPKPSHCFPSPPTASHSLSLPSHCLPLSSRWAHLNTASPWDSTGGTQSCWWSTALQGHCPSSLQEQGKFFLSGERQKSKPASKATGRRFGKLKVGQPLLNLLEENGACPPGHAGAQSQGGHAGERPVQFIG